MLNFKKNEKYASVAFYSFLTICAAAIVIACLLNLKTITGTLSYISAVLTPFVYGFIFAYLCNPIMNFFENRVFRFKKAKKDMRTARRALSLIMALLTVLAVISVLLYAVIPQTVGSYEELGSQLNSYITNMQSFADSMVSKYSDSLLGEQYDTLSSLLAEYDISFSIKDILSNSYTYLQRVFNYVVDYGGVIVGQVINVIMGLILAVYFLISKEKICAQSKKLLAAISSRRVYLNTVRLARFTHKTFGGFIVGKLLDSVIIGLLTFVVLWACRIPYYPLLAVIIGVTNIVPTFGPVVGCIFGALLLLIVSPGRALLFIIIVLIIQQLDGNVIGPKILGSSLGISSLWVVIAITLAGGFFGFAGLVVGVPTTAVIYVLVKQWTEKRLRHKNMPYHTEFYRFDPSDEKMPDPDEVFIDKDEEIPMVTAEDDIPDPPQKVKKKSALERGIDERIKKHKK